MTTEEEMRAGTIGELRQHNDTIELLDYRVEWPVLTGSETFASCVMYSRARC